MTFTILSDHRAAMRRRVTARRALDHLQQKHPMQRWMDNHREEFITALWFRGRQSGIRLPNLAVLHLAAEDAVYEMHQERTLP